MTRVMIDATHNGLPVAMSTIRSLSAGDIVALYNTGSSDIIASAADIASIPKNLHTVFIDQGFTGSPNLKATIRDCESGAWELSKAVNKTGWNVPRPTLYLGYPDTVGEAHSLGWRGDVWLVGPNASAPLSPPAVPEGINVVGVQWNFKNPDFDASVIFDPTWPEVKVSNPTPVKPTVPPGQWNDPAKWSWEECAITGVGLDGNFYCFAFNPATGEWVRQTLPGLMRD